MTRHGALLFALLAASSGGCRTIRCPYREPRAALVYMAETYSPRVAEILDTSTPHPRIQLVYSDQADGYGASTSGGRDIVMVDPAMYLEGPTAMALITIHEFVHVHATGHWDTLPRWMEEGLAEVVSERLLPEGMPLRRKNMDARYRRCHELVRELGLDQLERLARRAAEEGRDTIPVEWTECWLDWDTGEVRVVEPSQG